MTAIRAFTAGHSDGTWLRQVTTVDPESLGEGDVVILRAERIDE